jgi:Sulfotransferase family
VLARRLRFGRPIIVVSGLPRTGTSMMMHMLAAGGVPILTDGVRAPDASNPNGYFELEAVKGLVNDADASWLAQARGRAVKIVAPLLRHLPDRYNYRVILMKRDLGEVIASQNVMLARAAEQTDAMATDRLKAVYETQLLGVEELLAHRACFESLMVRYRDVVTNPLGQARRVSAFLERDLALDRMAAVVDAGSGDAGA